MKGDFSRDTFHPANHYSSVRAQQGRVQVDADWNEELDILEHRIDTETIDVVGQSGAPTGNAAFQITPNPNLLGDFLLSTGRYYVDGILVENDAEQVSYATQPDLDAITRANRIPNDGNTYLVYLDVWTRHLTALDDDLIREIALGGPDTATRTKTIWQVKWLAVAGNSNCVDVPTNYATLTHKSNAALAARATPQQTAEPCVLPLAAGYRGLENQLYRVEIHATVRDSVTGRYFTDPAADSALGGVALTLTNQPNQGTLSSGTAQIGDLIEVYTSDQPMSGTVGLVTAVATDGVTLTLGFDPKRVGDPSKLFIRKLSSAFKWSRDNGFVETLLVRLNATDKTATVRDFGRDAVLGFQAGQWVEISYDDLDLAGMPGELLQIASPPDGDLITFTTAPKTTLGGSARHARLRRWDGVGALKVSAAISAPWLGLEQGIEVRFTAQGPYFHGNYWQIPARAASSESDNRSGNVEWPEFAPNVPAERAPFGISHHYCRLGLVTVTNGNLSAVDCRKLFPPLTELTVFSYLGGDGQEVMPDLTSPSGDAFYKLPEPLIVGVSNGARPVANAPVLFSVLDASTQGDGLLANHGAAPGVVRNTFLAHTNAQGIATVDWWLDLELRGGDREPLAPNRHVKAEMLDAAGQPMLLPITFSANFSIAAQVAYDPGNCLGMAGATTVQAAISKLSHMRSLYPIDGDGQEALWPNLKLRTVQVRVADRCGPVANVLVSFGLVIGHGVLTPLAGSLTDALGIARCDWAFVPFGPQNDQYDDQLVLLAKIDASAPATDPMVLRFTATLVQSEHVRFQTDPARCPDLKADNVREAIIELCERSHGDCCLTVGRGAQFPDLLAAFKYAIEKQQSVACICLLPGQIKLPPGLPRLQALEISGLGLETDSALIVQDPQSVIIAQSLILRDVDFGFSALGALRLQSTQVTIDNCDFRVVEGQRQALDPALVTVTGLNDATGALELRGSRFSATFPGLGKQAVDATPLSTKASTGLRALLNGPPPPLNEVLNIPLVTQGPPALRVELARVIETSDPLSQWLAGAPPSNSGAIAVLVAALRAPQPVPQALIDDFNRAVAIVVSEPANVLAIGQRVSGNLTNNRFNGYVVLNGDIGPAPEKAARMSSVLPFGSPDAQFPSLSLSNQQLTFIGNQMTAIHTLLPRDAGTTTPGVPPAPLSAQQTMTLASNTFQVGSNEFLAGTLTVTGNFFNGRSEQTIGFALARASAYCGNSAAVPGTILRTAPIVPPSMKVSVGNLVSVI